jgi:hypothetical protein
LKVHKKPIAKGLREIKLDHLSLLSSSDSQIRQNVVPGKSLCSNCYSKLFVTTTESHTCTSPAHELYVPSEEVIQKLDSACINLEVSPASKIRKLSSGKRQAAIEGKVRKISERLRRNLEFYFATNEDSSTSSEKGQAETSSTEYCDLIEKLKYKCSTASREEKVKIISLLPESWSREKIVKEFNVSERLVRLTRNLVREQGILPVLGKKKGVGVSEETIQKVQQFFENDANSRMCPGKKDCTKVIVNGNKIVKQKCLVLSNLNELYVAFKNAHPECKVGRSKFCELRPKWCVLAGSSGTHSVCVCLYHQNIKLMIGGAKLNIDYKELLDLLVCDINNYNCMMSLCKECPGKETALEMLKESEEEMPDNVTFKQWVTTDRAEMLTLVMPQEEYFETLIEKLENLKSHHYVSKIQSKFLKEQKEILTDTKCIVLADFAENFTFMVQDVIQGYHWVNDQATVHPFVLYFKNEDDKLCSRSLCILSDYLEHNTAVVHAFQKLVTGYIKETMPKVEKIMYFSDGSGSQYKNRKNFSNLCNHKTDFDLEAEWHFFASCHGKNACDGVGGTTKREVSKASLQRTITNQIITVEDMYTFCKDNIKGITYFLIKKEEIIEHIETLKSRFENSVPVKGTRQFHKFHGITENLIRCYTTSETNIFEDHCVNKITSLTLNVRDIVACVYDNQWWLAEVESISLENADVFVHFYHPAGPRTSFKKSNNDRVWISLKNVLRKLSVLELTTATGRSYSIPQNLSEEISVLLINHLD